MHRKFFQMILRCKICYFGSRVFIEKIFFRIKPIQSSVGFIPKTKVMVLRNCLFHKKFAVFKSFQQFWPRFSFHVTALSLYNGLCGQVTVAPCDENYEDQIVEIGVVLANQTILPLMLGRLPVQCWGSGSAFGFACIRIRQSQVRIRHRFRILPSSSKNSKKNLDFYCFVTSL